MKTKTKTATAPDRTADALSLLEAGIKTLASSDEWARYLRMQAAFHQYSFSNVQLIMAQQPDATKVAGYRTWEKLGRQVRKYEKGIWILAPRFFKPKTDEAVTATEADDNKADEARIYFKAVSVFAIEQTDGEPLPSPVRKLEGDDDGGLFDKFRVFSESRGCPVTVEAIARSANGFFSPVENRIVIREGLAPAHACKTMVHEAAHSILHRDIEVYREHRGDCELEAESVAFVVLSHFGIDSGDYSFGYVASWSDGTDEAIKSLKSSAQKIQATAKAIIAGISEDVEEGGELSE